jgi:dolichol-phosphate mannosyltransferase
VPETPLRLSVVVPTLEEAVGIESFLERLLPVVVGLPGEVVLVDDNSSDGTAELARRAIGEHGQVVVRAGPPSLAGAVIEGWELAQAPVVAVIDADLSHPPELLPQLVEAVEAGADVAVATRYMPGGGTRGWPLRRQVVSRCASLLARSLTAARDPLSGFLALRRDLIHEVQLDPRGWKIGLEVLARAPWAQVAEVPYVFRDRAQGKSKFGRQAVTDYLWHLGRLHRARWLGA